MRWVETETPLRKPQSKSQRVGEVVVIEDLQPTHLQARPPVVKVNRDGVVFHFDHPEYVVRVDMHVIVMNLLDEHCRSGRTGIQVKSNKGERPPVLPAVRTNELALTEAHVCLVRQRRGDTPSGLCSRPASADMCQTHEPVEVCDLRRSLILASATVGLSGLSWMKTPNGLNGARPPGIGLSNGPSASSSSRQA